MMGERAKSEALFYYFKLEDHVPETHLLRLIELRRPCPGAPPVTAGPPSPRGSD